MKKISILGSTGSIGTQALEVIRANPEQYQAVTLTCGRNVELLSRQIIEFQPELAVCERPEDAAVLLKKHPHTRFSYGEIGLLEAASGTECDIVLNALMGMRGLVPTYHAVKAQKNVALANKETLVAGGQIIMEEVAGTDIDFIPVDSEHSAIFQCLRGNRSEEIKKILLTASGGPFRGRSRKQLEDVTIQQALKHPNWSMGKKITIDSATMMNKGLEVIEAKWIFDVKCREGEKYEDLIEAVVHPESIIHSMVEYRDGSVIAQMGLPDMKTPIAYSFSYPERPEIPNHAVNFFELGNLTFEKPDMKTFRCLGLAYEALNAGGSCPTVLNAANEVLVQQFLEGKISFVAIQDTLETIMNRHSPQYHLTLEDVLEIDAETRRKIWKSKTKI